MFKTGLFVISMFAVSANATPGALVDVDLIPGGDFTGKVSEVKGQAVIQGNKVTAQNIQIPLSKMQTGIALRDKHTTQKYLETDKFPDAVLVKGEGENGKGTGILRIKGIEKPIAGTYAVNGSEVTANFKIKLSDYNITGVKYMGVGVSDVVDLKVTVPAVKK
jgi:polyisoprenoid-binding protein YceI